MKRFMVPALIIMGIVLLILASAIASPDVTVQLNVMFSKTKDFFAGNRVLEVSSSSAIPTEEPHGVEIINGSFKNIETQIPDRDHDGELKTIEILTLGDTGESYINSHLFGNLHLYTVDEVVQLFELSGINYKVEKTNSDQVPAGLPICVGGIDSYHFEDNFYYKITDQFVLIISRGPFPDESFIIGHTEKGRLDFINTPALIEKFRAAGYDPKIEYLPDDSRPDQSYLFIRPIENGKMLSGDYIYSFKNGDIYIIPGFAGDLTLVLSLPMEAYLKYYNSSPTFKLGKISMSMGTQQYIDINGPEAIRIIKAAGYTPIIYYQKSDAHPDQTILSINANEGSNDDIFLMCNGNCYLKSGYARNISIKISRISSEYVETTAESTAPVVPSVSVSVNLAEDYIISSSFTNFAGKTLDEVTAMIQSLGLKCKNNNEYSDTYPVVGTPIGVWGKYEVFDGVSYIKKGGTVYIQVSLGAFPTDAVCPGSVSNNFFSEKTASEIIAIFQSYGYNPIIEYFSNISYPDQAVSLVRVIVNGAPVSGDAIIYWRDGKAYLKPGFTGEIILGVNKLS